MKTTLKIAVVLLCVAAVSGWAMPASESTGRGVRIGIAKIVQHEALDACEKGIQDALRNRGINATFDLQNANGDMGTAAQIANKFLRDRVDVAVGIATPTAVALANAIKDIPVVFSAITDPIAANLVTSLDRGEGNVTGFSDGLPTADHIRMFQQVAGIRTLGFLYTSSEENSLSDLAKVQEACRTLGITLVAQSINTSAELRQAAQTIIGRVDGIYIGTDNGVFSALPALIQVCQDAKKPLFSSDVTAAVNGGCFIANGFNYYAGGLATGEIVADILQGKNPADIPVRFLTTAEMDLLVDLDAAANCGITIPQNILSQANYIYQNGRLTQR
ncbi:MAG: ABC transporter substrate-binding protein [Treponema sp.]|jgi:putative ABC transport system substrate-binding protein|nr:ABC transporter substrate-binding protein [Treponema sp.]